jgi:hypothetical protein
MALEKKNKQPQDVIDYPIDYSEWLAERPGYEIDTYTVTVETGINLVTHVCVGPVITVFLGGGTTGTTYKVTVRATMTPTPLIKEFEFLVRVKEL